MYLHVCGVAGNKPSLTLQTRTSFTTANAISGVTTVPSDNVKALPFRVNVRFKLAPRIMAVMTWAVFWRRRS
jgi:hypothetical protein